MTAWLLSRDAELPGCLASLLCQPLQAWSCAAVRCLHNDMQPVEVQHQDSASGRQQEPTVPQTVAAEQAPAAECWPMTNPQGEPMLVFQHLPRQFHSSSCKNSSADPWHLETLQGEPSCIHNSCTAETTQPASSCNPNEQKQYHTLADTKSEHRLSSNPSVRSNRSGIPRTILLLLMLLTPGALAAPASTPSAEARQIQLRASRTRQALQAAAAAPSDAALPESTSGASNSTAVLQTVPTVQPVVQVDGKAGSKRSRRSLADPFSSVASISAPLMSSADTGPQALASCMVGAAEQQRLRPLSWERAMRDELGTLQVAAVWWSRKPTQVPMTIVTQLSAGRLNQLSAQCKGWRGPLSAAIYIPLLASRPGRIETAEARAFRREMRQAAEAQAGFVDPTLPDTLVAGGASDEAARWLQERPAYLALSQPNRDLLRLAEKNVAALHAAAERMAWACSLSMVLVYEVTADVRAATLLYPVNQLRNLARLQARTELIAQLDVDMLLSGDMAKWMAHANNSAAMIEAARNKVVYVMPAFEAHGHNVTHSAGLSDRLSMQSKRTLATAVIKQVVTHFDEKRFPQGHNTTDFPRWFQSTEPYPIAYTYRYEPWLIVHRTLAPWHDVRFRGYGNNKIQQVSHLNSTGHQFVVHPVAFIIHRAHALTEARKQLITDLRSHSMEQRKPGGVVNKSTLYGHTKTLFEAAKAEMDKGTFTPVLDPQTVMCMATLPWYQQT